MTLLTPLIHTLDGITFRLAQPEDLSFIQEYGRVFRVFDDHDSGNISFGVDDGTRKRFIKLAGAHTAEAGVSPAFAVSNMRKAERIYADIAHPNIVCCVEALEHPPYFGLVFNWVEGELLRRVNDESFSRFRSLPLPERLAAMDAVIDVLQHVHDCGYVAVDLYDASFLYDFDKQHLTICDADVYARKPMVNTMGRLWGSTRFMSPEEFEKGATIDEITNVYTLGAVSFLFFGDERTRTRSDWDAGDARFVVASQAVSPAREDRYQSIAGFATAWRNSSHE